MAIKDAGARATRGGLQGGAGWAVVEMLEAFNIYDFTERQANISIVVLTVVFSYLQNVVENKIGKGLLRSIPVENEPVEVVADNEATPQDVDEPVEDTPPTEDPVDPDA